MTTQNSSSLATGQVEGVLFLPAAPVGRADGEEQCLFLGSHTAGSVPAHTAASTVHARPQVSASTQCVAARSTCPQHPGLHSCL